MKPRSFFLGFLGAAAVALGAALCANALIDPFGYQGWNFLRYDRYAISFGINPWLYKLSQFRHSAAPDMMFGDSQVDHLDPLRVLGKSSPTLFSFAIPGQDLYDTLASVDYARTRKHIRRAYIGVSFYRIHSTPVRHDFLLNAKIADSSLAMNLSVTTAEASLYGLRALMTGYRPRQPAPVNIAFQRGKLLEGLHQGRYNTALLRLIEKQICGLQRDGTEAIVLVPPEQASFQKQVWAGYPLEYRDFKNWLRTLPAVIDYDVASPLTAEPANFQDLFHVSPRGGAQILAELASGRFRNAGVYHSPGLCAK